MQVLLTFAGAVLPELHRPVGHSGAARVQQPSGGLHHLLRLLRRRGRHGGGGRRGAARGRGEQDPGEAQRDERHGAGPHEGVRAVALHRAVAQRPHLHVRTLCDRDVVEHTAAPSARRVHGCSCSEPSPATRLVDVRAELSRARLAALRQPQRQARDGRGAHSPLPVGRHQGGVEQPLQPRAPLSTCVHGELRLGARSARCGSRVVCQRERPQRRLERGAGLEQVVHAAQQLGHLQVAPRSTTSLAACARTLAARAKVARCTPARAPRTCRPAAA